jgi:hypothetical protein
MLINLSRRTKIKRVLVEKYMLYFGSNTNMPDILHGKLDRKSIFGYFDIISDDVSALLECLSNLKNVSFD